MYEIFYHVAVGVWCSRIPFQHHRKAIAVFRARNDFASLGIQAFLPALAQPIERTRFEFVNLFVPASRAAHAVRPALSFQELATGVLIREALIKMLLLFHNEQIIANFVSGVNSLLIAFCYGRGGRPPCGRASKGSANQHPLPRLSLYPFQQAVRPDLHFSLFTGCRAQPCSPLQPTVGSAFN